MNPLRWLWHTLMADDEPREPRPDEIVVLAEAADASEAELWSEILNRSGVCSEPVDSGYVTWGGARMPAWRVLVRYGDTARARELLGLDDREIDDADTYDDEPEYDEASREPMV